MKFSQGFIQTANNPRDIPISIKAPAANIAPPNFKAPIIIPITLSPKLGFSLLDLNILVIASKILGIPVATLSIALSVTSAPNIATPTPSDINPSPIIPMAIEPKAIRPATTGIPIKAVNTAIPPIVASIIPNFSQLAFSTALYIIIIDILNNVYPIPIITRAADPTMTLFFIRPNNITIPPSTTTVAANIPNPFHSTSSTALYIKTIDKPMNTNPNISLSKTIIPLFIVL